MRNIVEGINIGYGITNIKNIVNTVAEALNITLPVYIMPLKLISLDENAYIVKQGGKYIIFVSRRILETDKVNDYNIKLFIHELTHLQQMERGDLTANESYTEMLWKGKIYNKSTPHENRPFEIEARRNEGIYFKQVKNLLKENQQ